MATSLRWQRFFALAQLQYAIRSEGDFEYRYANDLSWSCGLGGSLWRGKRGTLGMQVNVSGEHKGEDTHEGEVEDGTAFDRVFVGPQVTFTWRKHLHAEIGADFPVLLDNSGLQSVPDYRVRAAAVWRF